MFWNLIIIVFGYRKKKEREINRNKRKEINRNKQKEIK